ncbi:MAG: DUF488 family protein [Paludibacter sp.]|nr:DUF488 family protein [Paludibacter sp.]
MYYRRKILLSLLQVFGGILNRISLQKLLFLLSCEQTEKSFHFVPYKYGCFSFQANADLGTMVKYKLIAESDNNWVKADNADYLSALKDPDKIAIQQIKKQFGEYNQNKLVKFTYRNYPYYAINSTIAANILDFDELAKVANQKPTVTETVLFTIGYEGVSLEEYLNKLIINDIQVLCDVRKNALSMKYGFSKSQLQNACRGVGIEYVHIPEVGIESDKRQSLNTQAEYDGLFDFYKTNVLRNETEKQKEIISLIESKKRVALTCFEANIRHCHRKHLAESISLMSEFKYELKHI